MAIKWNFKDNNSEQINNVKAGVVVKTFVDWFGKLGIKGMK